MRGTDETTAQGKKQEALQIGVRGETYARLGYVFIARDYMPSRAKGELDLIGFYGETLAIVEVRTRLAEKTMPGLAELSITREKHEVLVRTAHYFVREYHLDECPLRFDVVAIEETPGQPPEVRLHRAALSPELRPRFNLKSDDRSMEERRRLKPPISFWVLRHREAAGE